MDMALQTPNSPLGGASAPSGTQTPENTECESRVNFGEANAIQLPHVVVQWQKNAHESIRVSLSRYEGREVVDCRVWYAAKDGELKPSPKGLTLGLHHLPRLATGIADALSFTRHHGLLQEGGEP